jgi:hypothetical protein
MRRCLSSTSASGAAPRPPISMESETHLPYAAHTEGISASCDPLETRASWELMTNHAHLLPCRLRCSWPIMRRLLAKYAVRYNCDDASNREPPLREL